MNQSQNKSGLFWVIQNENAYELLDEEDTAAAAAEALTYFHKF